MKLHRQRVIVWLIITIVLLQVFVYPLISAPISNHYGKVKNYTGYFPGGLLLIEDEAFEGTSFKTLIFSDGFLRVGDRAFSNMSLLKNAWFPESTVFIADSAFFQSALLKIYGVDGSYAQSWAREHRIEFERMDYWYTSPPGLENCLWFLIFPLFGVLLPDSDSKRIRRYLRALVISMRPQDRPELNPIDYRFP